MFNPFVRGLGSLPAGGYARFQVSGREPIARETCLTDDQWHIIMVETPGESSPDPAIRGSAHSLGCRLRIGRP